MGVILPDHLADFEQRFHINVTQLAAVVWAEVEGENVAVLHSA